jgi:hypothetical protein
VAPPVAAAPSPLLLVLVVSALPRDRVLELAHPAAQRAAHLGQSLGAEDEEKNEKQEEDLPDADVPHVAENSREKRCGPTPGREVKAGPGSMLR